MDHLVCKDELRRIIFIFEKKAKAFNQLLLDAQTFEEEDDLKEDLPANNEALSMKDMAKAALQRTELQAEVFQRLFTDLEMSLQAVSIKSPYTCCTTSASHLAFSHLERHITDRPHFYRSTSCDQSNNGN